jgi:hypothetical protein
MSAAKWILNFWPGLPQLWWRGTWQSLSVAVAFTALLNGALLTSLLEGVSWSPWVVVALWVGVCMFSLGTCLTRVFDQSEVVSREMHRQREAIFQEAQVEYLKGHWFEAEKRARELLTSHSTDAEARLLLISILRRGNRLSEANKQIDRLNKCIDSFPWQREIEQESERVTAALRDQAGGKEKSELIPHDLESERTTLAFPREAA